MASAFQIEQEKPEFALISELAENLVLRLPRCEDVMIRKAIQDVFRDFCRETKCLTAERLVQIEPGCAEYPLFPMFGGCVMDVRTVAIGPCRLRRKMDYSTYGTSPLVLVLMPHFVGCPTPPEDWVHQNPAVCHPRMMRVRQEEMPSLNSEKVPCGFIERYGEAICSGVMFRLCSMSGRSWSDANLAALERINYENAKSEERMRHETPPGGRFIDTSQVL